jgi:hypothetical protein
LFNRNSKIIREDSNGNMYVHGVNEQEVFNADEAFEWLRKGQLRKRTAPTFLNMDSSRSHTVFTIRVVQVSYFYKYKIVKYFVRHLKNVMCVLLYHYCNL